MSSGTTEIVLFVGSVVAAGALSGVLIYTTQGFADAYDARATGDIQKINAQLAFVNDALLVVADVDDGTGGGDDRGGLSCNGGTTCNYDVSLLVANVGATQLDLARLVVAVDGTVYSNAGQRTDGAAGGACNVDASNPPGPRTAEAAATWSWCIVRGSSSVTLASGDVLRIILENFPESAESTNVQVVVLADYGARGIHSFAFPDITTEASIP